MKAKELVHLIKEQAWKIADSEILLEDYFQFQEKITRNLKEIGDYWVEQVLRKGGNITLDYDFIDDAAGRKEGEQESPKSNTFDYIIERLISIYRKDDGEEIPYAIYKDPEKNVVSPQIRKNIVNGLARMFNVFSHVFVAFLFGSKYTVGPRPKKPESKEELHEHLSFIQERLANPEGITKLLSKYSGEGSFSSLFMANARGRYDDSFQSMRAKRKRGGVEANVTTSQSQISSLDDPISDDDARTGAEMIEDKTDTDLSPQELDFMYQTLRKLSNFIESHEKSPKIKQVFKGLVLKNMSPQEIADSEEYPDINKPQEVSTYFKTIQNRNEIEKKFQEITGSEQATLKGFGVKDFTGRKTSKKTGEEKVDDYWDEEDYGEFYANLKEKDEEVDFSINKVLYAFSKYMQELERSVD